MDEGTIPSVVVMCRADGSVEVVPQNMPNPSTMIMALTQGIQAIIISLKEPESKIARVGN